ncbi:MAG TPA: dodecin domain-containing protein [Candidatus Korarchaeota archaeon]|nr:dodecin domain-containing protein [Candidatus Korarchaeota archaeon]
MAVLKNIELVGVSKEGFEKAILEALEQAKKTVRNIKRIKVLSMSATVKDGEIELYRARVKITFEVER